MPNSQILTDQQIGNFMRDGFLFIPGFYSATETEQFASWTDEITAWPEVPGRHMVYYEDSLNKPGEKVVQRVENFTDYHDGFGRLFTNGRMNAAVSDLLHEDATLFKEKINYKLPGGDGFKAHQDAQAGWDTYGSYYVTALVSIDSATVANGCLEVAAGWHDKGLIGRAWEPMNEAETTGMDFIPFPTQPGDAMFFDSYAPHRSGPNLTKESRRVLYVTYNGVSDGDQRARYFADKRKSFPPDIERTPGSDYKFKV